MSDTWHLVGNAGDIEEEDVMPAEVGDLELAVSQFRGQFTVCLPQPRMHDVMRFLRDDPACKFEQVTDLTCVDYLHFRGARDRFGITYLLLSLAHNHRLIVKVMVNDPDPAVATVLITGWELNAEDPRLL